jgi:hypothetical protein
MPPTQVDPRVIDEIRKLLVRMSPTHFVKLAPNDPTVRAERMRRLLSRLLKNPVLDAL